MSDDFEPCPRCGQRDMEDGCPCGQVFRYRVVEVWGDAPDMMHAMIGDDARTIVDGWRGTETTWEVYDFSGPEPTMRYGWAGEYVGMLAEAR